MRRHSKEYVNSWAVEIRGGKLHADEVAHRNGFENLGEVIFIDYRPGKNNHFAHFCRWVDFQTFTILS